MRETATHVANILEAGWQAVITHGNGPQVGFNLRRSELASHELHTLPLEIIVAHTQGSIGYMLQQAIRNEFHRRGGQRKCISLITQTLVDPDDPSFAQPSKPIGSFMTAEMAQRFAADGWRVVEDAGRGWRRVVPSPAPLEIIELDAIAQALALGWNVVAVGGGGIPVVRNAAGELRGMAAVIDKDLASSLLAIHLGVDLFLISTGVEKVCLHFGQPQQQELTQISVAEARRYLAAGHFGAGSMAPKIEGCIRFLEATTKADALAIITNPENLEAALEGKTGTRIVR
ncbi:MAG: carbamate kinase [Caldilineaceae bacterium]